jgi:hypothetical protein
MDATLYDKCAREEIERAAARTAQREAADKRWKEIIADAAAKGIPNPPQLNLLKLFPQT